MRFHILVVEPSGYPTAHFLYDIVKLVLGGLEQAGCPTSVRRNGFEPGRINVIVGGHLLASKRDVAQIVGHGAPYVVVQSEVLHAHGLNHNRNPEQLSEVFLPLLQGARAVWDLCRRNVPVLADHGIAAQWLEPGWVPHLEDVPPRRHADIDFLFYGSVTEHRRSVFRALRARGHHVRVVFDALPLYRNDLIGRSRIQLVPRQSDAMNQLPWTRIVHQIHNRAIPVVEECEDQAWLQDLFAWAPSRSYVERCEEMLALSPEARRQHAEAAYERLRARPMATVARRLVDALADEPQLAAV